MPRKVVRFACDFKCGDHTKTTAKAMAAHEYTCWMNPANKTCKTCVHEQYGIQREVHDEIPPPNVETMIFRGCAHHIGALWMEANIDQLLHAKTGNYLPHTNCAWYEQR